MRKYKYIWLPAIIGVYFIVMAIWFGRDLLASGQYLRFISIIVVELLLLVGLFFSLRRRERLRREREDDIKS